MKNIHIIQTDKPSRLHKIGNELGLTDTPNSNFLAKQQNIYITSDEEIKEEDYSFYPPFGVGKNIVIDGELCFHIEAKNGKGSFTQRTYQTLDRNKKIILTTDQDLIKDGVQAIDDEFLEWFVKNPSCESVEVLRYKSNNMHKMNLGYKPIIPKEEADKKSFGEIWSTLTTEQSKYIKGYINRQIEDAKKWQQERSYSEEEVYDLMDKREHYWVRYKNYYAQSYIPFDKWFEQFKKK